MEIRKVLGINGEKNFVERERAQALTHIQQRLGINTILYPGPQYDSLDGIFPIPYHLDIDKKFLLPKSNDIHKKVLTSNGFVATFSSIPIKDGSLDALYYRDPDNMLEDESASYEAGTLSTFNMLKTVKSKGFIIYDSFWDYRPFLELVPEFSDKGCRYNIGLEAVDNLQGLTKISKRLPRRYQHLTVYRKEFWSFQLNKISLLEEGF